MKTLFKSLIALAAFLLPLAAFAQETGSLKVTVLDEKSVPMPGAVVRIVAGGPAIGGQTDMNGIFTFRALQPGTYDVEARMVGYKLFTKQGIVVGAGQTAYVTYPMQLKGLDCDTCTNVVVITDKKGPVELNYSTVHTIDAGQVKTIPVQRGDVVGLVTATCSSCSEGPGGQLVMRGARENATTMYVDGEKMYGSGGVPGGAIQQVTVLSGGIPASFGDMTGGVIIITTKSYYSGIAAKQSMYEEAAKEKAEEEKAAKEKSGEHTENGDQIIEKAPATEQPAPQQQAPAQEEGTSGGGN